MRIDDEYQLAACAIAVSVVLLAASGAAIIAGGNASPTEELSAGPAGDARPDGTDRTDQNLTAEESERIDVSVASVENGTVAVDGGERTCRGDPRVDGSDRTRTDVRVDGATVTLVEDHDEPFERIERERFAELVWEETSKHAGLDEHDHVELRVNRYYETAAREKPSDTVGFRVRPTDGCLPSVEGEVEPEGRSVDVRSSHPELEDIELNVTDGIGVLDGDERILVERLVESDRHAAYTLQAEFDDPTRLDATVLEATSDGEIEMELAPPDVEGRAVVVRIDLDGEAVLDTWTRISIESVEGTDAVAVGDADGNGTVTVDLSDAEDES
jgi:hypothetical protein